MSFSDHPGLTGWQKLGCATYFLAASFVSFIGLVTVVFDGWDEPPMPRWQSLLLFPGSVVLVIAGGVVRIKFFMRDKN
jgi:hypothetical protein